MRVALFTTDFPPINDVGMKRGAVAWWGGVGLVVFELATRMARRGFDVDVYTSGVARTEATSCNGHLKVHRAAVTYTVSQTGISLPLLIARLDTKPDVIHAHRGSPPGALGGWVAASRLDVPLVTTYHGDLFMEKREPFTAILLKVFLALQSQILADSEEIITLSQSMKENSSALKRWKSKVTVIPNGIARPPPDLFPTKNSARERLRIPVDGRVCLSIGTINFRKGYDVLLRAIALIKAEARPLVVLLGHTANAQSLGREIRGLGIADSVRCEGFVSEEIKTDYLSAADVLVMASRLEGLPLVLLEAFSHGVPVIASDLPVFREIINPGGNGLLFESANPHALASAILSAFNEDCWLSRAGVQAEETALRFDWEKVVDETERTYDRALTREHKVPRTIALRY